MDHLDMIMDALVRIALDELEWMREDSRRMKELLMADQVALHEKAKQCEMLMRKKQSMLFKEAAKLKLVNDFMLFIDAIDQNDTETTQNFDEKTMMNTVLTMMNGDEGHNADNGEFAGDEDKKEA